MNGDKEQVQIQEERGPVTFVNPLENKPKSNKVLRDEIITWVIRGIAIVSELLFFFPLCVVSCSAGEDYDKYVGGLQAVFGFELSYVDGKIDGIWWLAFVFIFTAWILFVWIVKDMKLVKLLNSRKVFLCLGTGVASAINIVFLIGFMAKATSRIEAANAAANLGTVYISFTAGFWILLILQILLCVASVVALIWLIIVETDVINGIGADFKKFFVQGNKKKENT